MTLRRPGILLRMKRNPLSNGQFHRARLHHHTRLHRLHLQIQLRKCYCDYKGGSV